MKTVSKMTDTFKLTELKRIVKYIDKIYKGHLYKTCPKLIFDRQTITLPRTKKEKSRNFKPN